MAVLLDTRQLSANTRAKAMSDFLDEQAGTPMVFAPLSSTNDPFALEASIASFGAIQAIRVHGSAVQALRGREQLRCCADPIISVVQVRRGAAFTWRGTSPTPTVAHPGHILILDLTEEVEVRCSDGFETFAIQMTTSELALPPEAIRSAAHARVASSTIANLLGRQMTRLGATFASGTGAQTGMLLGDVTADLARSLVAELASAQISCEEALEQTLATRLEHYILAHLGDSNLSPEQIARAHFISVRKLYYLWSGHSESLSDWITHRRLDTAYKMLTAGDELAILEIARKCGFTNFAHFSRRFRQRFGMTPISTRRQAKASKACPTF